MLVLGRKPGEKIKIGENVVIHVLETRDGRARLGIEAPRDMKILREELAEFTEAQDVCAASTEADK